nr:helix-turn-helix domain-containing protein [uncultured Marinifilum sp.]
MTKSILLESLSAENLKELIRDVIREEVQTRKDEPTKTETKFYSRGEVSSLLKLSLPTLNEYTKEGRIQAMRIGRRVLYSEQAVQEALKVVPNSKGKRS